MQETDAQAREIGDPAATEPSSTGFYHAWDELNMAEPALTTDYGRPLSRLMYAIWQTRGDLREAFPLTRKPGRNAFVRWFLRDGVGEFNIPARLTPAFEMNDLADSPGKDAPIPRALAGQPDWLHALWRARPDVAAKFDPDRPDGLHAFLAWLVMHGAVEHKLHPLGVAAACLRGGAPGLAVAALRRPLAAWRAPGGAGALTAAKSSSGEADADERTPLPVQSTSMTRWPVGDAAARPRGANLIGYARGELGIGEDVRTAAQALATTDVAFSVHDFAENLRTRRGDTSVDHWLSDRLDHRANLLFMTGFEVRTAFFALGPEAFDRRYNIGIWPWELPHWPAAWRQAFWFVDEVWTPSRFVHAAIAEQAPVPVIVMPPAVTLGRPEAVGRAELGLPTDRYLFLFTFDGNSFITRKNPFACIQAFRQAFPHGDEAAGLVIKAMNVDEGNAGWQRLQAMAAEDPRIVLLPGTMTRPRVLGLIRACDAFVSLHRAEGFGRGPAEAMSLGKPVIVTDYSGNTDFTKPETAYLVNCHLRALEPEDYPFWEGQHWAEPDVDHAARRMREVARDPETAARTGVLARAYMARHHHPETVGRRYAARLRAIGVA